jgi:WD40 repeat protein
VLAVLFVKSSPENDSPELLLSAGWDQTIRVFEAATARPVRTLDNHTAPVNDLALRPGHDDELPLVASAGQDKTVRFWQPSIGRLVRFVRLSSPPLAVRWLPSGDFVVAACADGKMRAIDWQTASIVLEKKACAEWATALVISPDGKQAIVGDERGELHAISLDGIKRE